jgi:hypothetical protein
MKMQKEIKAIPLAKEYYNIMHKCRINIFLIFNILTVLLVVYQYMMNEWIIS